MIHDQDENRILEIRFVVKTRDRNTRLVGNFLLVEQLLLLVVEQLLNPILSSNHVSRKSLEEAEVTCILSRI